MAPTKAEASVPVGDDDIVVPTIAWKTLGVVSMVGFMASIEITIISLALEDIRLAFPDESESLLSWVFNGYNITVAAVLLPAGWFSDRYGRKTIFCAGVLMFGLGSLCAGLAPSLDFLVAARVLQAIGGAFQVPAGMALLLHAFPDQKRQLAIGIWGATAGLAAAFGPTLGALLVDATGWRAVFLINVPVAVVILFVGSSWLVGPGPDLTVGRVDLIGVPAAALGVGAAVLAIVDAEEHGWTSRQTILSFLASGVLLGIFVLRSRNHPRPLFDLGLFRERSFWVGSIGQSAFVAAFFLWLVPFPTFLRTVWGWSVLEAGFAIAPGPLMAMIVAPISGKIADRIGQRIPLIVSGIAGSIGIGLQIRWVKVEPNYFGGILLPAIFIGIAAGIGFSGTVGAILQDAKPHQYAMAGAARSTMFQLSLALSIAIAFTVIGRPATPEAFLRVMQQTWTVALGLYVVQYLLFFALFPRQDKSTFL